MKRIVSLLIAALISTSVVSAIDFNAVITAIFGGGNPDVGWNAETQNDVTVALRAKNRTTGDTTHVDDTYYMPVGFAPGSITRAAWNFEFSIRTGNGPVGQLDYYLLVDLDPSVGVNYNALNVLTTWTDNSFGNDATPNGGGIEAGDQTVLANTYNILQQSQNIGFAVYGLNPLQNATYDYTLYAVEKGAGSGGVRLASVTIQVVVGSGGATVQDLIDQCAVGVANHGDYVSCVTDLANYLNSGGVITNKERAAIVSAAARSDIGKKNGGSPAPE